MSTQNTFEELVPPEICFQIFTYLDFRYMMQQIPKVCSSWRNVIITRIHTIHIYPNVEKYIFQNSLYDRQHAFESKNNENGTNHIKIDDLNIEKDIFPFISYLTKFIQSNSMKVYHLFIHGDLKQTLLLHNHSRFIHQSLNGGGKMEFTSRFEQESETFLQLLNEYGEYFQNCYTWPLFNMHSNLDGTVSSSMVRLCDCNVVIDLLKSVSHSLNTLVIKNIQGNYHFASQLQQCSKLKILVLEDVTRTYHLELPGLRFLYCNDIFYVNNSFETPEYFHVNSNLTNFSDSCRHVSFCANNMSLIQLENFLSHHSNYIESAKIAICKNEYSVSKKEMTKIVEKLMECICLMPRLKCLDLSLDMIFDICMSYYRDGEEKVFVVKKTMILMALQGLKELRLSGSSFLGNGFDAFLEKMIHLESLACAVCNEVDEEILFGLLETCLKKLKRLELQISQPSYCTLSPTLLKHLSQFLVNHSETSALTHILIKNLDAENSDPLMDMLNDLYKHYEQNRPSSQILHLGFQFRKKPSQQALDSITHQCRHFIKVHMMSHDAIDTDPFIPFDIDYSNSQQMDQVVSKRNEFKQLIACSKITCLACGMVLNRNDYEEHCQRFHYSQDLMYDHSLKRRMDFSNYEIQCPSCHADVRRCDFDEHVENVCSRNRVKLCTEPRKTFQQIISEYQSIPSNTEQHDNHL